MALNKIRESAIHSSLLFYIPGTHVPPYEMLCFYFIMWILCLIISGYRLADFDIVVTDNKPEEGKKFEYDKDEVCAHRTGAVPQGGTEKIECTAVKGGQYAVVVRSRDQPLTLCEFEVYGTPARTYEGLMNVYPLYSVFIWCQCRQYVGGNGRRGAMKLPINGLLHASASFFLQNCRDMISLQTLYTVESAISEQHTELVD